MGKGGSEGCREGITLQAFNLLGRDEWRTAVFERDKHTCVHCGRNDVELDAHHLINRHLWAGVSEAYEGGYVIDNGVSLCSVDQPDGSPSCHMLAEQCELLPSELRTDAGISIIALPASLVADEEYDTWGNPILNDGTRGRGPMFYGEGTQKVLKRGSSYDLYRERTKYPRTPHLPWSPSVSADDLQLDSDTAFAGKLVVVSEKLDGEATTIGADYTHARSVDSGLHPSRTWVRSLQGKVGYELPQGWRLCGENMQAKHSIAYENLHGYFYLYSIWDETAHVLDWDQTEEWSALLGIPTVPVIWKGIYDVEAIQAAVAEYRSPYTTEIEGYVIRDAGSFAYNEFADHIAKAVRKNHVQTGTHWMSQEMVANGLANE